MEFVSLLRATECGLLKHENRSRFSNSVTSASDRASMVSADQEMSCSYTDLSSSVTGVDCMSESTDVLGQLEAVRLRPSSDKKRDKSLRLSLPSAINSAGNKIRGKLKSGNSSSKQKSNVPADKKDKARLKDLWNSEFGFRKSVSQERDLPQVEIDPADTCSSNAEGQSITSNQTEGVVFKQRYTPESEKRLDTWNSGAADAPLADPEGDSPLFIEPPTRSFTLSHMPNRYHGDYDTAFALASLQGDCLSYQSQVHSLVEPTPPKSNSLGQASGKRGAGNSTGNGVCLPAARSLCYFSATISTATVVCFSVAACLPLSVST